MSRIALFAVLAVLSFPGMAQDAYPTRPITMIVPFPPGGVADIVGRPLAATMEKTLNQPVVIVNRTGAGGAVGMAAAAKAAPDGYTILMALSSISIFPVSDRIMGRTPPYELADFAPIALVTADPTVLVVRSDGPFKTVKDFVDYAKANPGKINYSSSGVYGTLHVAMEMFAGAAGIKLFHVPYQGGGPAVRALLAGEVQASAQGPAAAIAQIRAGKMRALAGWGAERLKLLPDIPTLKELGYDAEFYIWSGVFAPAGTPAPVVGRLREAVRAAANAADFRSAMEKVSTPVSYLDAPEFRKFWERDAKRLAAAIEKIGPVEDAKKK
ncbi:MAG TPA: tripartite tricarboxylate transporter substrate binding protein [Ramlibacter sp.]|uniref:Bug family tripartite tricarboxylate transporter substrate binding protein n=1 Tax=Ramlibacter sp. TaxID=1917967 RepID=UPI002D7E5517|nr:tripartite tricarboxylate transporter substrate binding protein [Ramlibacter sp.]HET8747166.1 tripartite tricarboxylate transporter substrate binding protein [Ramlibacter sp.]